MIVEISGSGDVTERMARDLIGDFVPADSHVYLADSWAAAGMDNVYDALLDLKQDKYYLLWGKEDGDQDAIEVLIVLDAESEPRLVKSYQEDGKPVYDLCRGLYPVAAPETAPVEGEKGSVSGELPF